MEGRVLFDPDEFDPQGLYWGPETLWRDFVCDLHDVSRIAAKGGYSIPWAMGNMETRGYEVGEAVLEFAPGEGWVSLRRGDEGALVNLKRIADEEIILEPQAK